MMKPKSKTLCEIMVFLVSTIVYNSLAYISVIQAGISNGGQSKGAGLLMLAPGRLAAGQDAVSAVRAGNSDHLLLNWIWPRSLKEK